MPGPGRLFLGARRRRARRLLRRRVGWVVGALATALLVCLVALAMLVRRVGELPALPTSLLLPVVVEIDEEGFRPGVIIVQPGAEVRWVFKEGRHTVTDLGGEWDSGPMQRGVFLRSMPAAGAAITFLDYECTFHGRRGSIHLLPAPIESMVGGI